MSNKILILNPNHSTTLMNAQFLRITTKDKLILQGIIYKPVRQTNKAFLHIHGMGGNFYENRFIDAMAETITSWLRS